MPTYCLMFFPTDSNNTTARFQCQPLRKQIKNIIDDRYKSNQWGERPSPDIPGGLTLSVRDLTTIKVPYPLTR